MTIQEKAINELRVLSAEIITNAGSGHPGIALGSAPILYALYADILDTNPTDAKNIFRDRFVLSAGHGSSLLYSTLYAMGYDISNNDLKNFRKIGSKTPGHPEVDVTSGVDASTGPLGQGISNAVGMAIAQKHLASRFNKQDCKIFDNKIFCLCGDGCLMEGISYEALSLAANLKLDNFVLIYDCNKITIEGKTDITFDEDIKKRFEAINFAVLEVKDGNNVQVLTKKLLQAKKSKKPTLVIVHTQIGYGTELAGNQKIHGTPLSKEQIEKLKISLLVSKPDFDFSPDVKEHFKQKQKELLQRFEEKNRLNEYQKKYPQEYKLLKSLFDEKIYQKAVTKVSKIKIEQKGTLRDINHQILQKFNEVLPNLFGGSADVATSTKAFVESANDFNSKNYLGTLMRYGIREHAMAGISNGIALYGGLLPYQSCFFSFFDYLKPALRMGALMNLQELFVFSHDSITAGQDGPTHQTIEQLASLRLVPNTIVFRPYNASELLAGYIALLQNKKPTCLLVNKDKCDYIESNVEDAQKGGYVLLENKKAKFTFVSTGGDLARVLKAVEILAKEKIFARIVSIPCISIFDEQSKSYQNSVFKKLPKVFVEASNDNVWYKYKNQEDLLINLSTFGASGSPSQVLEKFGLDENSIAKAVQNWQKSIKK